MKTIYFFISLVAIMILGNTNRSSAVPIYASQLNELDNYIASISPTADITSLEEQIIIEMMDDIADAAKSSYELSKEEWKTAMQVLQEHADQQNESVSKLVAMLIPGYTQQLESTSAVPEPATMLLIGAGLAGLGLLRKSMKI